jgi:hypothetical protein
MGKKFEIDLDLINDSEYWNTDLDKTIHFGIGLFKEGITKRELRESLIEILSENQELFKSPNMDD